MSLAWLLDLKFACELDAEVRMRATWIGWPRTVAMAAAVIATMVAAGTWAEQLRPKPKLGANATPIQLSHDYLRTHPAPDYWALSPYYDAQATGSGCSLAAVTMLINALRGLPPNAKDRLATQKDLLAAVAEATWADETREGGRGVTFDELRHYITVGLAAYHLDAAVEVFRPQDRSGTTLAQMRRLLAQNELDDHDIVLAYFDQGVLTGDWDGPHISPIGAYDAERRQVLIMDIDREWYVPYWSGDEKLLEALERPAPADQGALAGETGGLIRVLRNTPGHDPR